MMARSAVSGRSCAHEVRRCALEVKRVREDGVFEGYASLFNQEDLGGDVILPGAFRESLRARRAGGIKMLFQHDPNQPIGVWLKLTEDARGLYVEGRLMVEVEKAREVLALMRAGALDGLSIGFKTVKGRRDARSGVRRLERVDLWEISVVTFPMLPEARVASVKGRWEGQAVGRIEEAARLLRCDRRLLHLSQRGGRERSSRARGACTLR